MKTAVAIAILISTLAPAAAQTMRPDGPPPRSAEEIAADAAWERYRAESFQRMIQQDREAQADRQRRDAESKRETDAMVERWRREDRESAEASERSRERFRRQMEDLNRSNENDRIANEIRGLRRSVDDLNRPRPSWELDRRSPE